MRAQGCDGSVLIDSTAGEQAEKDAPDNKSLAFEGFDTVQSAKAAVEAACPDTVSCADVLALATRDAISLVYATITVQLIVRACMTTDKLSTILAPVRTSCRVAGPSSRWSWAGWTA